MKKLKSNQFINNDLLDTDYLVMNYLGNLNEDNDKTIKDNEKVSDSVYFHGSIEDLSGYLNNPINWITKDYNYAKTFATENGYVYECSANLGNLFNVGKTDARVYDLIPVKPYRFSREFTNIIRRLNLSEDVVKRIIDNIVDEYKLDADGYKLTIRLVVRAIAFKRILEGLGYNGIQAIEYDSINHKNVETYGLFDEVKILDKVEESLNEKNYKTPTKMYDFNGDEVTWDKDAEDFNWWSSEADKWAENYAKSYKVKMSPEDFLDLTTDKGAKAYKVGDSIGGLAVRELDKDELNKETYQPIFLLIAFRNNSDNEIAQVVGHEGRHRMFALMNAGYKKVDVELRCEVWDTNFDKHNPFDLKRIYLIGQFNKSVMVTVYNPIPMSWKNHKAIRPELTDEELKEYFEEIPDEGESYRGYTTVNDCPIYATDETYKIKSMLENSSVPYRLLLTHNEMFLMQDARGNKTHYDMAKKAAYEGYYDEESDWYDDESYMVFFPSNFDGEIRWHTTLGDDSYDSCRVYPIGVIFVRDSYAYNNKLFDALGNPEREIYYSEDDDEVTIIKNGESIVLDVPSDLNGEPNNAITYDIDAKKPTTTSKKNTKKQLPTLVEIPTKYLGLSFEKFRDLVNNSPEEIYDMIERIIEDKYGVRPEDFDYGNSSEMIFVRDIVWPQKESLNEEENQPNILDALDKEFGQEEVYMWSTYILPNGHFLNPDKAEDYWDEINEEPGYEHYDFEDWAYAKGYQVQDIFNNCIKMNVTYPYLGMPDKARPTQEQLNAIRKIIENKDSFEQEEPLSGWYDAFDEDKINAMSDNRLAVFTPIGDEVFDLDVSDADDIIRAINQAYVRGSFLGEDLNESTDFPITVYTYQKPQVRELLERGETYIADYSRSMFSNHVDDKDYKHPYKELVRILGLHNCPIFGALAKEDLVRMLDASGIDWNESDILRLEIPKDELRYTEYYDWTDYIYFWIDRQEEDTITQDEAEDLLRNQKSASDYDLCQVVFDKIEPQWYEDGLEEESI